jgi:hypothetical protein
MRRLVCTLSLLAALGGERYVWFARQPRPVPIVRILPRGAGERAVPEPSWWIRHLTMPGDR